MRLEELDFDFPESLVAQHPCEPRDACRLLVADPRTGMIDHRRFRDIEHLLHQGDLLVVNESKVFPARAWVRKQTGGKVELLFLRRLDDGEGHPARRRPPPHRPPGARPERTGNSGRCWPAHQPVCAPDKCSRSREERDSNSSLPTVTGAGRWREGEPGVLELLDTYGAMPLPPYIHEPLRDERDYQTVYANVTGSAAAPTAGLHFTTGLIEALRGRGVAVEGVTLHVGVIPSVR